MKRLYFTLLFVLLILHAYVLHVYGISTFLTTCLFYYVTYCLITSTLLLIKNDKKRTIIQHNLRSILLFMLVLEFILTFMFKFINNYMENEHYMYFSEYKKEEQCKLLQDLGLKKARFTYTKAYIPMSSRVLKRKDYTYVHHYNLLGFRGPLPPVERARHEFRIVVLGDSFVEGDGAPEDSTLCVLLQKELNKNSNLYHFTVINGGISGSNPIYARQIYFQKLHQFRPNLVINTTFSNDIGDINIMQHHHNIPTGEYMNAISHLFRLFYYGILGVDNFDNSRVSAKTILKRSQIIKQITNNNMALKQQLLRDSIRLLNIYIPSKEETTWKKSFNSLGQSVKYDVNLFNYFSVLQTTDSNFKNTYYWPTDAHLKPIGYLLAAQILAKNILLKYDYTY